MLQFQILCADTLEVDGINKFDLSSIEACGKATCHGKLKKTKPQRHVTWLSVYPYHRYCCAFTI